MMIGKRGGLISGSSARGIDSIVVMLTTITMMNNTNVNCQFLTKKDVNFMADFLWVMAA
jgi:hypothetical protein